MKPGIFMSANKLQYRNANFNTDKMFFCIMFYPAVILGRKGLYQRFVTKHMKLLLKQPCIHKQFIVRYSGNSYFVLNTFYEAVQTLSCSKSESIFPLEIMRSELIR